MATEEEPKKPEAEQPVPPATPPEGEAKPSSNLSADALSDGTVPTVLSESDGVSTTPLPLYDPKKATVTSVYRRADIATSFITLIVTLAIVGIILGLYIFLSPKKKATPAPKITTLDQSEITKLGGFLTGNSLGGANTVLTVSSSSLFKGRVAIDNDLKVTGNTEVGGNLSSSNLTVTKNSTLSNTSINGALIVTGPVNLQSPANLAAGATVGGNLTVSGNGSFGGAVSAGTINVKTLSVTGDLNLAGHLAITGPKPSVVPEVGAGSGGTASVDGNDSGGTIMVNTGAIPNNTNGMQTFVTLKFHTQYAKTPHVLLTAVGGTAGSLGYNVIQTASSFTINLSAPASSSAQYAYNYWVIQ